MKLREAARFLTGAEERVPLPLMANEVGFAPLSFIILVPRWTPFLKPYWVSSAVSSGIRVISTILECTERMAIYWSKIKVIFA